MVRTVPMQVPEGSPVLGCLLISFICVLICSVYGSCIHFVQFIPKYFIVLIANSIVFQFWFPLIVNISKCSQLPCVDLLPANVMNSTRRTFLMDHLGFCRKNEGNNAIGR